MALSKAQRLQPVLQQAELVEQRAAEAFVQQQKKHELLNEKLQDLYSYRSEFIAGMKQENVAISIIQIQQQRFFLEKLNTAITFQQQQLKKQQDEVQIYKHKWLQTKQKSGAFDQLIKTEEDKVLQRLALNEQKTQDDRSQHINRP
ncbi:MAG: flagellar FliJ family protein [Pseudomonadales bacterium]|nr:flagellar FliJ family protein [Pseudomonadales bacterium]